MWINRDPIPPSRDAQHRFMQELLAQDKTYQGPEDASEPQPSSSKKKKKPKKGVKSTALQYG